jgi:hypothetical protein
LKRIQSISELLIVSKKFIEISWVENRCSWRFCG